MIQRAAAINVKFQEIDAQAEAFPLLDSFCAVVITGSSASVPTQEKWMVRLQSFLATLVEAQVPTFGICFGHQILAEALGGKVQRNPRGREIGSIRVTVRESDPLLAALGTAFDANATHLDTVVTLPPNAKSLAWSELDDHQVIRFGPACYGVQFHPEFNKEIMRGYVDARRHLIVAEGLDDIRIEANVNEGPGGTETLRAFMREFLSTEPTRAR